MLIEYQYEFEWYIEPSIDYYSVLQNFFLRLKYLFKYLD